MTVTLKHFIPSWSWKEKVPTKSLEESQNELKGLIFPVEIASLPLEARSTVLQSTLGAVSIKDEKELDRRITELARDVHYSAKNKDIFKNWISATYKVTYDGMELPQKSVDKAVALCEEISKVADEYYFCDGTLAYIVDPANQDTYLNESKSLIRFKGFGLIFATVLQLFACFEIFAKRAGAALEGNDPAKQLTLSLLALPLVVVMLLAAIYTIIDPYNGRKFYAACERALWHGINPIETIPFWAPCFQPRNLGKLAQAHLFGAPEKKKNGL